MKTRNVETRALAIVATMTLEQKIGQLNQATISDADLLARIDAAQVGTVVVAGTAYAGSEQQPEARARQLNELQRRAIAAAPAGMSLIFARDCIHGHRTVFPIPLGQAAAFDASLVHDCARATAVEATGDGVRWTFAPMIDVGRDARWGRVAEGNGEDPTLTAALAMAAVDGFQADGDLARPDAMAACAKHFVGYGAPEGGRDYDNCEISDHTLHNVHLPPFRAACGAGVATVMSGFHAISGLPMAAHRPLLRGVLRDAWRWPGVVVSDWGSIRQLTTHGVAASDADSATIALDAGNDVNMADGLYLRHLSDAVRAGRVDERLIDEAATRVIALKLRLGLIDAPFTDETRAAREQFTDAHRALARRAAHHACVLLKNDDALLPLRPDARVLLCGPLAAAQDALLGTWTLDGRRDDTRSLRDVFAERFGPRVTYAEHLDEASFRAASADVAIVALGESPQRSGEDAAVTDLCLPPGQIEWLRVIKARGTKVVAVIFAGRPLVIADVAEIADAILYIFHAGTETATAIADVLVGDAEPTGRLPVSLPRATGQVPIYYARQPTGRSIGPSDPRNRYIDSLDTPLFPFGFGLTYSTFELRDVRVESDDKLNVGETLRVGATLCNVGAHAASDVAQLYVRGLTTRGSRPVRELKRWTRVALAAGETRRVTFDVPVAELGTLDERGQIVRPSGRFHAWIARDAQGGEPALFKVIDDTLRGHP